MIGAQGTVGTGLWGAWADPGEVGLQCGCIAIRGAYHFLATEHAIVRSFEPGEDWRYCYVDDVLV